MFFPSVCTCYLVRLREVHCLRVKGLLWADSHLVDLQVLRLTVFCILVAICIVRSAVVPPAPQVMSQKVGFNPAILSCLMNKFSTPYDATVIGSRCLGALLLNTERSVDFTGRSHPYSASCIIEKTAGYIVGQSLVHVTAALLSESLVWRSMHSILLPLRHLDFPTEHCTSSVLGGKNSKE
jgi:hypothetical protein